MSGKKILRDHRSEKCSTVRDILRKVQSHAECAGSTILVASNQQVKSIENIEASEDERIACIVNRFVVTTFVIQAPVTVAEGHPRGHRLKGRPVLLNQFLVLGIVVRNGSV